MEEEIKKRYEEDCKNATFTNEEREKYFYRLKDLQVKLQSLAELFQNPMRITNNMINEYSKINNEIISELSKVKGFIINIINN